MTGILTREDKLLLSFCTQEIWEDIISPKCA